MSTAPSVKDAKPLTQAQIVRLECVRLTYRLDKDANSITEKADKLADYILQGARKTPQAMADKAPEPQPDAAKPPDAPPTPEPPAPT